MSGKMSLLALSLSLLLLSLGLLMATAADDAAETSSPRIKLKKAASTSAIRLILDQTPPAARFDRVVFPDDEGDEGQNEGFVSFYRPATRKTAVKKSPDDEEMKILQNDRESLCDDDDDDDDDTFCEEPQMYPEKLVNSILTRINEGGGDQVEKSNQGFFREQSPQEHQQEKEHHHHDVHSRLPPIDITDDDDNGEKHAFDEDSLEDVASLGRNAFAPDANESSTSTASTHHHHHHHHHHYSTHDPDEEEEVEKKFALQGTRHFHETALCRSIATYVYPKRARNRDDAFKFIINAPDKRYIQSVRVRVHFANSNRFGY